METFGRFFWLWRYRFLEKKPLGDDDFDTLRDSIRRIFPLYQPSEG